MSRSASKKSATKNQKKSAPVAPKVEKIEKVAPPVSVPAPSPEKPAALAPAKSESLLQSLSAPGERFYLAALAILVVGIVLRQVRLGEAPFHPDEAIHAFFSYGFADYKFDPVYHGPLLYHLTAAVFGIFKIYDYTARLVPSLLGIGLIAMILGPARVFLGNRAALASAALVAVSPSIVTYSRHLLHDSLVLVLTLGAVLCFLTALVRPAKTSSGRTAIIGLSACLTLFLATKANVFFVAVVILAFWVAWRVGPLFSLEKLRGQIPLAVFGVVVFASIVWPRDNTFPDPDKASQHLIFQIIAVLGCGAVWLWLFSRPSVGIEAQGRENWKKGRDWTTYALAIGLALWLYVFLFGNGAQIIQQWILTHQFPSETFAMGRENARTAIPRLLEYWGGQQKKPRLPGRHDYYLVLALLYEVPILVAGVGGLWHAAKTRSLATDFLAWWAVASWAVYAVANEKVPWLLVHLVLPFALLGGVWLGSLRLSRAQWGIFASLGFLFCLRGDSAMIFERAGDHAEPILYAQTPDKFRDTLTMALRQTQGDGRAIWMEGERQWPSVWYLREDKNGSNPLRGASGTPIGNEFKPNDLRAWIGKDEQWQNLVKSGESKNWNHATVAFLIWPRASWTAISPERYWHWFFTRQTLPEDERLLPQSEWKTSILAGKGEWSRADAVIGWRK